MRRSEATSRGSKRGTKKGSTGRSRRLSGQGRRGGTRPRSTGGGSKTDEGYLRRRRIFAGLVALVAVIGVWLTFASVRNPAPEVPLTAKGTAPPVYTVKVLDMPATDRETGEQIMTHPDVKALAGNHRMMLMPTGEGRVALCVGEFPSEDSVGVRGLLERFREFEIKGKRIFSDAAVYSCSE